MIAPGPLVGNIHALLAGASGAHQRAIHVDDGLLEKGLGLFRPHLQANVVESILQAVDVGEVVEATAEVTRRGRVGDAASADRVEEDLVVAAQLNVFEAGATTQGVVGEIEDVIGLVVGHVEFEQDQISIDGRGETEPVRQSMHGADPAMRDAAVALADFVVDVAGGEHRLLAAFEVELVEPAFDSALASVQLSAYLDFHSKSLSC